MGGGEVFKAKARLEVPGNANIETLESELEEIANELVGSCTMGAGQFCTNPGLVLVVDSPEAQSLIDRTAELMQAGDDGVLFSASGVAGLKASIEALCQAGAECLCGGQASDQPGFRFQNTVLKVTGEGFLQEIEALQTEAFGASTLFVVTNSLNAAQSLAKRRGNRGDPGFWYARPGHRW